MFLDMDRTSSSSTETLCLVFPNVEIIISNRYLITNGKIMQNRKENKVGVSVVLAS